MEFWIKKHHDYRCYDNSTKKIKISTSFSLAILLPLRNSSLMHKCHLELSVSILWRPSVISATVSRNSAYALTSLTIFVFSPKDSPRFWRSSRQPHKSYTVEFCPLSVLCYFSSRFVALQASLLRIRVKFARVKVLKPVQVVEALSSVHKKLRTEFTCSLFSFFGSNRESFTMNCFLDVTSTPTIDKAKCFR